MGVHVIADVNVLVLFDGSNVMRRAYSVCHGDIERTVSLTLSMVRKQLHAQTEFDMPLGAATHAAFILDHPAKNFRHTLYPKYKNRTRDPKISADMKVVTKALRKQLPEMGVRCAYSRGFEADDLMAAFVKQYKEDFPTKSVNIRIVSNDKDMTQLIDRNVVLLRNSQLIHRHNCEEIMGAKPKRVVCMLMLIGDAIDNIPGIKGIGPVAARKLIASSKRIERADPTVLTRAQQAAFIAHKPLFALTRELITLRADSLDVVTSDYKLPVAKARQGFGKL